MTDRFGLRGEDLEAVNAVFACYPQIEKAILYGSRAKGNYKNGSDIDLTLMGGDDLTLDILGPILTDLDDLLLPYTIDISIFRHIDDPEVIDHIQRVGATFYEKTATP